MNNCKWSGTDPQIYSLLSFIPKVQAYFSIWIGSVMLSVSGGKKRRLGTEWTRKACRLHFLGLAVLPVFLCCSDLGVVCLLLLVFIMNYGNGPCMFFTMKEYSPPSLLWLHLYDWIWIALNDLTLSFTAVTVKLMFDKNKTQNIRSFCLLEFTVRCANSLASRNTCVTPGMKWSVFSE